MAVGPWQILVIALIILLLFGASRLSDIGKGLGEGIRNFKKGVSDEPDPKDAKQLPAKGKAATDEADERSERKA
jgi:sec-independent protein translocase protein TatA